jgi:hypothetical protein
MEKCDEKTDLFEFIFSNLNLFKLDIEEDIKKEEPIKFNKNQMENSYLYLALNNSNTISDEKLSEKEKEQEKKPYEIFLKDYTNKFNEIYDDIVKNDFIDNEFKKNFFTKFLELEKNLLKNNNIQLMNDFDVKIKCYFSINIYPFSYFYFYF